MKGILNTRQTGMSLVEVMVALLVLGVGVMGYAALQLRSVKLSEDTYARSQAMSIAQDAIERIRANRNAFESYKSANWQSDPADPGVTCSFTNQAPTVDSRCTEDQLALVDIFQLKTIASTMLPSGELAVVPCEQLSCVVVAWNETVAAISTGSATLECRQADVDDNDRGDAAHCVIVDIII